MDDLQINSSSAPTPESGTPSESIAPAVPPAGTTPPAPAMPEVPKPMMVEKSPSSSFDLSGLSTPEKTPEKSSAPEPMFDQTSAQAPVTGEGEVAAAPAKSGTLKLAMIIVAILVVAGAAGAAIFYGKGGFPFKGALVTNDLKLAPMEQTTCPTDQYAPLVAMAPTESLKLLNGVPAANAQLRLVTSPTLNTSKVITGAALLSPTQATQTTQPGIMVLTATQQTQAPIISLSTTLQQNTLQYTQQPIQYTMQAQPMMTMQYTMQQYTMQPQYTMQYTQQPIRYTMQYTQQTMNYATMQNAPMNYATMQNVPINYATMQNEPPVQFATQQTQTNRCIDIPHDTLIQGGDECKLIDQLYADPATYLLNDTTQLHLSDWYKQCHPAPIEVLTATMETTPTTPATCGDNQEFNSANNLCVCKPGYFDVSGEVGILRQSDNLVGAYSNLSSATEQTAATYSVASLDSTASIAPANTITNLLESQIPLTRSTQQTSGLVCVSCDMIKTQIDGLQARLDSTTDQATKDAIQSRIDTLNTIAEKNGCNPPPAVCTGNNESLDANGQCVCKTNYTRSSVTQQCEFDCDSVIRQIQEIQSSLTQSPETTTHLVNLQNLATQYACNVPTEEKPCDRYERLAADALSQGNFEDYLTNTNLFLDNNCRKEYTTCEKRLIEASSVNRVINSIESISGKQQYQNQFDALKSDYYNDPECNNVSKRCSEIDQNNQPILEAPIESAATNGTQAAPSLSKISQANTDMVRVSALDTTASIAPSETSNLYTLELSPGTVFQDDNEYYQQNCIQRTQETTAATPRLICSSNPDTENIGQSVTWSARVEGVTDEASNPFSYSWSGDAMGDTSTVKATYTTTGIKAAVVTATRDGMDLRATCSNDVSDVAPAGTPPPPTPPPAPASAPPPAPTSPPAPTPPPAPTAAPTPTPAPATSPAILTPPPPAPSAGPATSPTTVTSSSSPIVAASSPTPTPSPEAPPVTEPGKVTTASTAVSPSKVSSPAAPVSATATSAGEKITPAPGSGIHAAAAVIPPAPAQEIAGTGPEVYLYLIGFLATQLFFFRRKIYDFVTQKK